LKLPAGAAATSTPSTASTSHCVAAPTFLRNRSRPGKATTSSRHKAPAMS
jgi:hypothetical protein